MSGFRCQVSHVKKIMLYFFVCFCDDLLELYGGGSVINGAYIVIFCIKVFWHKFVELVWEGSIIRGA